MRIYERDYRYLLRHIVPQHRLSPDLRREVGHALTSGDSHALRTRSLMALEELCDSEYFERVAVRAENGDVVVDYRKTGGRFQLSVAIPRSEWEQRVDAPPNETPRDEPPRPLREASGAAPPVPDADSAVDYLPEIIRTFTLTDRTDPILDRLESLLGTMKRWLGLAGLRLFLLDEVVTDAVTRGDLVRVVSDQTIRETEFLRVPVETGAQQFVHRDDAPPIEALAREHGCDTIGVSPVFSLGRVRGVMAVCFPAGTDAERMREHLNVCNAVVRQVVDFHHQFANMTSVDALTGLYNRHFYDLQLPVEIERAMRSGSVVSMLVIDIDDFKRINDDLGHKKGDEALVAIADLIRSNLRKVDLPFRYGGEEIVILLPGTSEFESVHTAERLRRVISEYDGLVDAGGRRRDLTVSVGVSVYPDTAKTAEDLFTQADAAMYRAKQAGKNRVVLFKEDS